MIRAVFDTNLLASGAIAPAGGTLASIIDAWQSGRCVVVVSTPILDELERTLHNPYFLKRLGADDSAAYLGLVRSTTMLTPITVAVSGVATHPEDDLVLGTAASAGVDCVVTGDRQLQRVGSHLGIAITSPAEFLSALASQETGQQT